MRYLLLILTIFVVVARGTCVETTTADFFIIEFGVLTTDYMEPIDTEFIETETEVSEYTEYASTTTDTYWEEVFIPTTQVVLIDYAVSETFVASETTEPGTLYSGDTTMDTTSFGTLTQYVTSTVSITIPTAMLNLVTTYRTIMRTTGTTTTSYGFVDVTSTVTSVTTVITVFA